MIEAKKVGNKYVVYDHVLNLTIKKTKKADADELADALNEKYSLTTPTEDNTENETT